LGSDNPHFAAATSQIIEAIRVRRAQLDESPHSGGNVFKGDTLVEGLPQAIFEVLKLTHMTTTEFLRHFWNAFLSGDEKRVGEINNMVGSLKRSLERIEAVAQSAEEERLQRVELARLSLASREQEGKKRRKKKLEENLQGGRA